VIDIDTLVPVAITIASVLMAVLGACVTEKNRWRIVSIISILAVSTVALTWYGAWRTGKVQAGLINGGDSFEVALMAFNGTRGHLYFRQKGDYPMREVHAWFLDVDKYNVWYKNHLTSLTSPNRSSPPPRFPGQHEYLIPALPKDGSDVEGYFELEKSGKENFLANFVGINGFWSEYLSVRRINGKWVEACRVNWEDSTPEGKGVNFTQRKIYEYADPEYPLGPDGKIDWNY